MNFKKAFMHLTNYSINKMSDEYKRPSKSDVLNQNDGTKRTLTSLKKTFLAQGLNWSELWASIVETCQKTMAIYCPMLTYNAMLAMDKNEVKAKPFSVLGLDLLVDHKMRAWILEVNDHPSLNIYFDTSKEFFGQREMTEDDICPIDLHVKTRLVSDMIAIARADELPLHLGSLSQIHPHEA
jgi:hypothetical protein